MIPKEFFKKGATLYDPNNNILHKDGIDDQVLARWETDQGLVVEETKRGFAGVEIKVGRRVELTYRIKAVSKSMSTKWSRYRSRHFWVAKARNLKPIGTYTGSNKDKDWRTTVINTGVVGMRVRGAM